MALGNAYQATIVQTCNDTRFGNVLNFRQLSGSDSPDPKQDLADLIESELIPFMAQALSVQWVPKCVHIRQLGLAGQDYFRLNFAATTGDVAGEALPTDICANVEILTALLGRGSMGRIFISGIPETSEEDNCLNEASLSLLSLTAEWLSAVQTGAAYLWLAGLLKPGNAIEPFVEGQPKSALTVLKSRKPSFAC